MLVTKTKEHLKVVPCLPKGGSTTTLGFWLSAWDELGVGDSGAAVLEKELSKRDSFSRMVSKVEENSD